MDRIVDSEGRTSWADSPLHDKVEEHELKQPYEIARKWASQWWTNERLSTKSDLISLFQSAIDEVVGVHNGPYFELLYEVQSKYPNETRHETALRYIRERESWCSSSDSDKPHPIKGVNCDMQGKPITGNKPEPESGL